MVAPTPVSGAPARGRGREHRGFRYPPADAVTSSGRDQVAALNLQWIVIGTAVVTIIVGLSWPLCRMTSNSACIFDGEPAQLHGAGRCGTAASGISGVSDAGRVAAVIGATYRLYCPRTRQADHVLCRRCRCGRNRKNKDLQLDGIGRKMPWEFAAFTLAALSMAGLPPMAGFIAKWYLGLAVSAGDPGQWWILLILVGASVLNLAYFLPCDHPGVLPGRVLQILHLSAPPSAGRSW